MSTNEVQNLPDAGGVANDSRADPEARSDRARMKSARPSRKQLVEMCLIAANDRLSVRSRANKRNRPIRTC